MTDFEFKLFKDFDSPQFQSEFLELPRNEKVSYAYKFLNLKGLLPRWEYHSTKSTTEALRYKQLGNNAFFHKDDIEALKLYTRSVASAVLNSLELAIAYANRSAALYKLERYEACMADIDRALKENYPEDFKPKLIVRRKKCESKLRQQNGTPSLILKRKENFSSNTKPESTTNSATNNYVSTSEETDQKHDEEFLFPTERYKNRMLPNMIEELRIDYSPELGRHIIASKDIESAEILSLEKPYASVLFSNYQYSHCSNCYVRCESLIPCHTCSLIMFCSESCRQNASDRFHRIECKILSLSSYYKIKRNNPLAFRMLMIATKQGEELDTLMKHPIFKHLSSQMYNPAEKPYYYSDDLVNVLNLSDHYDRLNFKMLWSYCQNAAFLVHMLRYTEFFGETCDSYAENSRFKLTVQESFMGYLSVMFILKAKFNAYEISEFIPGNDSNHSESESHSLTVGSAVYLFHSLFNHSCDSNISVTCQKEVIVAQSMRPIKAGEQLCLDYGRPFESHPRNDRRKYFLENYFFICRCEACEFDWPVFEKSTSCGSEMTSDVRKKLNEYCTELNEWLARELNPHNVKLNNLLREYSTLLHQKVKKPCLEYAAYRLLHGQIISMKNNYFEIPRDKVLISL